MSDGAYGPTRLTVIRASRPVPLHTYDDPTVAVFLDPAHRRPRPAPPWAAVTEIVVDTVDEMDGDAGPAGCLAVTVDAGRVRVTRWSSYVEARRHPAPAGTHYVPALDHGRINREVWNGLADEYQEEHAEDLAFERRWQLGPFPNLGPGRSVLGDVRGVRVLELGCGGGQLGGDLRAEGGAVVGLDVSRRQLRHAPTRLPVVEADAEAIPLAGGSIDLVFAAFGAIGAFSDARRVLREVARVLRPGGRAVWSWNGPVMDLVGDDFGSIEVTRSYFDRRPIRSPDVEYHLTYGDWVEAIVGAGLRIDALHEPEPDLGRWRESGWPWWSRERTSMLPTMVVWEVSKPKDGPGPGGLTGSRR